MTSDGPSAAEADYYIENGCLVFTARYLLKRGYCCENGCRHCPYGYRSGPRRAGDAGRRENEPPG